MNRTRASLASSWPAYVGAIVLLAAGFVVAFYEEQLYQEQRSTATREQAQILAASVTAALSFGDRAAIGEYVKPMRANPEIEAVAVYSSGGQLMGSFSRAGPLPVGSMLVDKKIRLGISGACVPVAEHKTLLGTVCVRGSPEPWASRASRYAVLVLLGVMAVLVLSALALAQSRLRRQAQHLETTNERLQEEMSERSRAEEALRQSQKMEAIGQLSGGIAHDLNNHLMIINGNLSLLKRKLNLPETDRHVSGMREGVNRAAALTQRVLSFSRKQTLSPCETDLNDLIVGMRDLLRNSLQENIDLKEDLRAKCVVIVDRNQMENVILNLVNNARDAMPRGGELYIRTEDVDLASDDFPEEALCASKFVKLVLKDMGAGMSDEVRARALEPFFTTKPIGQGTGLGLSTAFGFVRQSGGHLTIDSAPGRGTSITIYLPCIGASTPRVV